MVLEIARLNLFVGWIAMLGGAISGAIIGLFFYKKEWMGGYSAFRRRMTRLGHISFFGLGFINVMFALSMQEMDLPLINAQAASLAFIVGVITMPPCCFLTAWRESFRYLFPVPVMAVLVGVVSLLIGWAPG